MPLMLKPFKVFKAFVLIFTFMLVSCAQLDLVSMDEFKEIRSNKTTYRVQKGDTLYSISLRFDMDYRDIAAINMIEPPYSLHTGQTLKIQKNLTYSQKIVNIDTKKEPESQITQKSTNLYEPVQENPKTKKIRWEWPVKGLIIKEFKAGDNLNQGIEIETNGTQPVRSAANGTVVYVGSGIRGLGKLIIIKHNNLYLSAYAHNDNVFVTERQHVKVGEKIAEIGNTGKSNGSLHFQIRREGKSVDPLKYLPKR